MINSIYLVSFLEPSGPINQAYNIVTGFDKTIINPVIVTLFPEKKLSWLDKFREEGLEIIQFNCNSLSLFSARKKLMKLVKERNVSVVHAAGVRAVITASLLPKSVKTVMTARSHMADLEEKENSFVNMVARWFFKYALKRINVLASCSKSLAADLQKECGLSFVPIQNGVDTDKFVPLSNDEKKQLKAKLGIPSDKLIFISCAVLYPRKNMELLINSFCKLKRCDYIFLIVGEGEEKDKLQYLAKNNPNIVFTGKKSNVQEYYQASEVFVSSSLAEGLPNTVLEAMACGLPCVLSNIGSHEEILEYDKEAGVILDLNNKDWSEDIETAFSWNLEEKSRIARQLIENNLSKYIMAAKYADLYLFAN